MNFMYTPVSGIYRITCLPEDKSYIGKSKNIGNRWASHLSSLADQTHSNSGLQQAYNAYGITGFIFEVIELTSEDRLREAEARWIECAGIANLYNATRVTCDGHVNLNRFINYINATWLVPSGMDKKLQERYRIWKDADKASIIDMAHQCKIFALYRSEITFNRVVRLLQCCLGYSVDSGSALLDGQRKIYKLVVSYDAEAKSYPPAVPTENDGFCIEEAQYDAKK